MYECTTYIQLRSYFFIILEHKVEVAACDISMQRMPPPNSHLPYSDHYAVSATLRLDEHTVDSSASGNNSSSILI